LVNTTDTDGDIRLNILEIDSGAGWGYYPVGDAAVKGDLFLDKTGFNGDGTDPAQYELTDGDYGQMAIYHEIGHTLGLKHPNDSTRGDGTTLDPALDNTQHTIMSYNRENCKAVVLTFDKDNNIGMEYKDAFSEYYSLYDVDALQSIYGVNSSTNTEDNTYTFKFDDYLPTTIFDAGGIDTIDVSQGLGSTTIDLRSGSLNSVDEYTTQMVIDRNITIASDNGYSGDDVTDWITDNTNLLKDNLYTGTNNLGISTSTIIENVNTGAGNDTITDNEVDNIINTGAGDDAINLGNGGFDHVDGGTGNDTIYIDLAQSEVSISNVLDDNSYNLIADDFAVNFTGIETIQFNDNSNWVLV